MPEPPLSNQELVELYNKCNQLLFGGGLQPAVVEWRTPSNGSIAYTWQGCDGTHIVFSPLYGASMTPERVRQVLLHEMCHVCGSSDISEGPHGLAWRAAMLRLSSKGETWVAEEISRMDTYERECEMVLQRICREMDKLPVSMAFSEVCTNLTRRFARARSTPTFMITPIRLLEQDDLRIAYYWAHRGGSFGQTYGGSVERRPSGAE